MVNTELLCFQCRGIGTHLEERGKTYIFSPVALGTWGIFSSYGGDGASKLLFVQLRKDSCLVVRDTSEFSSRFVRAIWRPLDVSQKAQGPFPVATVILGFLSIFKTSQASSPFQALNSACLSSCQRDVSPPVEFRWGLRAFSRVSTGVQTSLHFVR